MEKPRLFALALAASALAPGCIATSREIVELRDDINQLRLKLNELQTNQADLADKMSSLDLNISAFSEKLEDNKNVMSLVARRLDDMEANISSKVGRLAERIESSRTASPPAPAPVESVADKPPEPPSAPPVVVPASPPPALSPGELYRMAYDDFTAGRYDTAAASFKIFLEKYPDATLAPYARYYLAESFYARAQMPEALDFFDAVWRDNPKSELALSALFKKALILERLGKDEDAKKIYAEIIKNNPTSQEAASAAERLKKK